MEDQHGTWCPTKMQQLTSFKWVRGATPHLNNKELHVDTNLLVSKQTAAAAVSCGAALTALCALSLPERCSSGPALAPVTTSSSVSTTGLWPCRHSVRPSSAVLSGSSLMEGLHSSSGKHGHGLLTGLLRMPTTAATAPCSTPAQIGSSAASPGSPCPALTTRCRCSQAMTTACGVAHQAAGQHTSPYPAC